MTLQELLAKYDEKRNAEERRLAAQEQALFLAHPQLQALQAQAQQAGLDQLTAVDVTSLSEVSAVYAGRVKIIFGTMNDIEYKCSWAARLLLGEEEGTVIGAHETGTLDVSHRTQEGKGQAIWRAGAI